MAVVLLVLGTEGYFRRGFFIDRDIGAILFGLMCLIAAIWQIKELNRKDPVMTITENGLQWNKGFFKSMGEVSWCDIGAVDYKDAHSMFVFSSVNREPYIARLESKDRKRYAREYQKIGGASLIWIDIMNIHFSKEEFLSLVETLIEKNRR